MRSDALYLTPRAEKKPFLSLASVSHLGAIDCSTHTILTILYYDFSFFVLIPSAACILFVLSFKPSLVLHPLPHCIILQPWSSFSNSSCALPHSTWCDCVVVGRQTYICHPKPSPLIRCWLEYTRKNRSPPLRYYILVCSSSSSSSHHPRCSSSLSNITTFLFVLSPAHCWNQDP